jgi:hypothetical protein
MTGHCWQLAAVLISLKSGPERTCLHVGHAQRERQNHSDSLHHGNYFRCFYRCAAYVWGSPQFAGVVSGLSSAGAFSTSKHANTGRLHLGAIR